MARPGFVLQVDERTPAVLVPDGAAVRLERFPLGSSVIYPPDPGQPLADLPGSIVAALDAPLDAPPLADQLRPGMRLTITFDDITTPQPPMRRPDVRGRIIEAVLTKAAAAGVDDVELICATGLHRRCTPVELQRMLGERVFRSFFADGRLTNHDAEDADRLVTVGETDGLDVRVNRRFAESDLVVAVQLLSGARDGGLGALARGLGSLATIDAQSGLAAQVAAREGASVDAPVAVRVAELVGSATAIFTVEAVLTNDAFTAGLDFLGKREWDQNLLDQAAVQLLRGGLRAVPASLRRRAAHVAQSSSGVTTVVAGAPAAVDQRCRTALAEQQTVSVDGQADVVITGVGGISPYSVNSVLNPVLAAWSGFSQVVGAATGTPLLRPGGAVIMYHPVPVEFSTLHHPSYVDFFAEVLPVATDPVLVQEFEARFAEDPWYRHLYQSSYAFHGIHPFHLWYKIAAAAQQCGDVIWVGGNREAVTRMGFRAASTLADALEIVSSTVGREPRISVLHSPPQLVVDVRC